MVPQLLSVPGRQFSPSSFMNNAISTAAASPLQASFTVSCRSPLRASHRSNIDEPTRSSRQSSHRITNGPSIWLKPPPQKKPGVGEPSASTTGGIWEEDSSSSFAFSEDSNDDDGDQAAWLLQEQRQQQPHSPGLPPPGLGIADGSDKLGVLSAINIIVGKTVGVGAYSVPSAVFAGVGSVGMALLLWVLGSLISFCGLAVYLDLGTAMPRSGGERVYLERIFRRPHMLATCMFMAYVVMLGFSAPNAIVLGEYALYALDIPPNRWNVRAIAVVAVTCLCWTHARHPRLGLRLVNVLGVAKMIILLVVIVAGVAGGLMGVGAEPLLLSNSSSSSSVMSKRRADVNLSGVAPRSTAQRNFSDIFAGSSTQPYDYATALLKVIYCFRGYSTANQVLSEVRDPVRTLMTAAPLALSLVSVSYLALNVAFFLVVDKEDFKSAGVVAAGIFFRNVFGPGIGAERILPLFVIISAAGNIAATSFAQARVNEELARDGLLPWSRFWSTTGPHTAIPDRVSNNRTGRILNTGITNNKINTTPPPPARGLLLHWLVSTIVILLPPPGRIYNFLVNIGGYPVSVISVAVSLGLLYLHRGGNDDDGQPHQHYSYSSKLNGGQQRTQRWITPFRAPKISIVLFAASNCLLLLLPWIPPTTPTTTTGGGDGKSSPREGFVWFAYPATALGVLMTGAAWWVWWIRWGEGSKKGRRVPRRGEQEKRNNMSGETIGSAPWEEEDPDESAMGLLLSAREGI
ncbi:amino acid transporter-like protein [Apodospora peruviana]|uniref:Amino acid transporter-like protein n=1 Tax=Apodospora peruviana TaxID=516989 RepID=A0AAE0MFD7_9PEZI|nr:amino acid transporter-like protein [Apodospora peruviana]